MSLRASDRDPSADPGVDFYRFACGGWIDAHPLPADRRNYARTNEIRDRNDAVLRRILERPGATGDLRKASDYYGACVDTDAIEARGLRPLQPALARIDALSSREELPALVGYLHRVAAEPPPLGSPSAASAYPFFSLIGRSDPADARQQMAWVRPDGLGLPGRDYYLKTDERSLALRRRYHVHVERTLNLAGASVDAAGAGADAVLAIETSLADALPDSAARRDPNSTRHLMTVADLQAVLFGFDWPRYAAAAGAPAFARLIVPVPEYLHQVKSRSGLLASASNLAIRSSDSSNGVTTTIVSRVNFAIEARAVI